MALNLLRTRTIKEAKEFLNRSFFMYLAGSRSRNMMQEIRRLEERAQDILKKAGFEKGSELEAIGAESVSLEGYEKLQSRRREEKRAAKMLRSQLADERGYAAETRLAEVRLII